MKIRGQIAVLTRKVCDALCVKANRLSVKKYVITIGLDRHEGGFPPFHQNQYSVLPVLLLFPLNCFFESFLQDKCCNSLV